MCGSERNFLTRGICAPLSKESAIIEKRQRSPLAVRFQTPRRAMFLQFPARTARGLSRFARLSLHQLRDLRLGGHASIRPLWLMTSCHPRANEQVSAPICRLAAAVTAAHWGAPTPKRPGDVSATFHPSSPSRGVDGRPHPPRAARIRSVRRDRCRS